jgi:hypothetical protein
MAFKKTTKKLVSVESPEALFNDLRGRRKIQGLLAHQADVLRRYVLEAQELPDVALQLPTGSGKTLVGLLLGEWRRQKNGERVLYLCPTNQLVHQVVKQAQDIYGIDALAFTGAKTAYKAPAKTAYQSADTIAVTSYSALFNTSPYFAENDLIILDDAHSAENYIGSAWSIHIQAREPKHKPLFAALTNVLRGILSPLSSHHLELPTAETRWDEDWVDSVPLPAFNPIIPELTGIFDTYANEAADILHPWSWIKNHLDACHIYIARGEILIRPLIPPTDTHRPFADAKQRVYMSATLGAGGDLERITGRRSINRLPVPATWETQGVGRRLFLLPSVSLDGGAVADLVTATINESKRAVILTTAGKRAQALGELIKERTGFEIFDARQIESSKTSFIQSNGAAAVIANRFDGIDFPGDECRMLVVDQLPRATNLQERFFATRMAARVLLDDRIMTRVVQGFGRCTRGNTDFAAVLVLGDSLFSYLIPKDKRSFFHPELQAELQFGIDQSRDLTTQGFIENLRIFFAQGKEWREAESEIVAIRQGMIQRELPGTKDLRAAVGHEVDYQMALWSSRFNDALDAAQSVLGELKDDALRGYRALWNYLAGNAVILAEYNSQRQKTNRAADYYAAARKGVVGIRWLADLGAFVPLPVSTDFVAPAPSSVAIVEALETELEKLGVMTNFKFDNAEQRILKGIFADKGEGFEEAQKDLGAHLGYEPGKDESDGSPDPWWQAGATFCLVFEDHAGADETGLLDVKKARQTATHINWIKDRVPLDPDAEIVTVLVTPVRRVKKAALPHLNTVLTWPLEDFREWAKDALSTIRELRKSFQAPGDLAWQAQAFDALRSSAITPPELRTRIEKANSAHKWEEVA